jgi:hypothetical protein
VNGPAHYERAEQLLDMAGNDEPGSDLETYHVAKAQAHATLANVAAQVDPYNDGWTVAT